MITSEKWVEIPGFNGRYLASDLGEIKSVDWNITPTKVKKGRILKPVSDTHGYCQVTLVNDRKKPYLIHRLIMISFTGEPSLDKPHVNHINGVKSDNRLCNLEWCNRSYNCKHSFAIGLQCNKGERHPSSKLTEIEVITIRELRKHRGTPYYKIAKAIGMSKTQVMDICNYKSWTHI